MTEKEKSLIDVDIKRDWPNRWAKCIAGPNRSKKLKRLRLSYRDRNVRRDWRAVNPDAACGKCKHLEGPRDGHAGVCGIGYESGGWYQPVKDLSNFCMLFKEQTQ